MKRIDEVEIEFGVFLEAMKSEFYRRAEEPENTFAPWKDFEKKWLRERLDDEIRELQQREKDYPDDAEGLMDEFVDIANFCMMLWVQLSRKLMKEA